MDLPSVILAALNITAEMPTTEATVSIEAPAASRIKKNRVGHDSGVGLGAYSLELRKPAHANYPRVLIKIEFDKKITIRHVDHAPRPYRLRVTGLAMKLAPMEQDALDSLRVLASFDIPLEQRIRRIVEHAHNILDEICEHVEFDDVGKVPEMFAEAILRTISSIAPAFKIEEIGLGYGLHGHLGALTATFSLNDTNLTKERKSSNHKPRLEQKAPHPTSSSWKDSFDILR